MKPGCCSAISPCSHQQRDKDSICVTCTRAAEFGTPLSPRSDRDSDNATCDPAKCINGKCRATGECACPPWPATDRDYARLQHAPKMREPLLARAYPNDDAPLVPAPPPDDLVNPKTLMGARRVDLSLLPAAGIIHGAHAMMDGAVKYNPYNWRDKKVPARTYISAAMRHLADFLDGEETAADSGVHHLGHVIGCCAIVLDAMETGNLIDDRPKPGAAAAILARLEKVIVARLAAADTTS